MPRVERDALQPGEEISGPAVVTESTATTWLPPGWSARVTTSDALILTPDDKNRTGGGGR